MRGDPRFPQYADLCRSADRLFSGALPLISSADRVRVLHDRFIASSRRLNAPPDRLATQSHPLFWYLLRLNT
jgi:hypothetical protein